MRYLYSTYQELTVSNYLLNYISWAVAAVAVFGVTQLGASAVCNVRPVKYGAFDKRL